MENWRTEFLKEDYNRIEIASARTLIRQCTPRNKLSGDLKLILLWKFVPFIYKYIPDISELFSATKLFVDVTMNEENNLEEFASILTYVAHLKEAHQFPFLLNFFAFI